MKGLVKTLLWRSGLLSALHRLQHAKTLTVVMFHRVLPADSEAFRHSEQEYAVTVEEFAACLRFFCRHYTPVSLAQVLAHQRQQQALPARALLITFDDGWHDNVQYAEPLLREYGLPATLFVNVDAVCQTGMRWWQDALVALANKPDQLAALTGCRAFYEAGQALLAYPLGERAQRLAAGSDYAPRVRQMLTAESLAGLDSRIWSVGSHALSHVPLTHVADAAQEVDAAADYLQGCLQRPVEALAFPHGRYNAVAQQAAQRRHALVFGSQAHLNDCASPFAAVLGRIHIPSAAVRNQKGQLSNLSLAWFLWRRAVVSSA